MIDYPKEMEDYVKKTVNPIINPLIIAIMTSKPNDVISFSINFLNNLKNHPIFANQSALEELDKENISNSNSSDEDKDDYFAEPVIIKRAINARHSISAEAYGEYNKLKDFNPRFIPKSEEQRENIKKRLLQSFLFSSLNNFELNIVINAMKEENFRAKDIVIKQGEEGDNLYVVEKGHLKCFKSFNSNKEPKFVKDYFVSEAFGELALLYNAPRAATIIAETDCILWSLDRDTFNHIVKASAIAKRERFENLLKSIKIFQTMDDYEIGKLADIFREKNVKKGDIIIKQGEKGDNFYILEDGEACAIKELSDKSTEIVMEYKNGDYFGELALMNNEARAATILAKTDCKIVYVDKIRFSRILGSIEEILKRNIELYKKFS